VILNVVELVDLCIQCDINLQQEQQHLLKMSSWKRVVTLSS